MTLRTSGAGRGESEVENKKAGARGSTEEYEQSTWCPDCKTGIAGRERKTLPSEQDSAGGDDGMLEPRLKRHVELRIPGDEVAYLPEQVDGPSRSSRPPDGKVQARAVVERGTILNVDAVLLTVGEDLALEIEIVTASGGYPGAQSSVREELEAQSRREIECRIVSGNSDRDRSHNTRGNDSKFGFDGRLEESRMHQSVVVMQPTRVSCRDLYGLPRRTLDGTSLRKAPTEENAELLILSAGGCGKQEE
jgi:hypothetical protein